MRPLQRLDGYLPIEDHGLIGDGNTAALVGRDGGISWLCAPRFDSPPVFCALLDHRRGGTFLVAPDGLRACEQHYVPDTGVLVTVLEGPRGTVEITDAMLLDHSADLREDKPAQRHALRRCVRVRDGEVALRVEVMPRGRAEFAPTAGGVAIRLLDRPELPLCLHASRPLAGARTVLPLKKGDTLELALCWGAAMDREEALSDAAMHHTIDVWRRWTACVHYEGPQRQLVRRSAVTLKMLDYLQNGALVAAPTS
ncbi:MAG: trehalase-like domain-containing protein, partial [Myxococcales bacterium]